MIQPYREPAPLDVSAPEDLPPSRVPWRVLMTKPAFLYTFIFVGIPLGAVLFFAIVVALSAGAEYIMVKIGMQIDPAHPDMAGLILVALLFGAVFVGFLVRGVIRLVHEVLLSSAVKQMTEEEWKALPQPELDSLIERCKKSISADFKWQSWYPDLEKERSRRLSK